MLIGSVCVQTLMQVPESACLIVDYEQGMQLPAQSWPRVRKGLQKEEVLPWDILLVCFRQQPSAHVCCIKIGSHFTPATLAN